MQIISGFATNRILNYRVVLCPSGPNGLKNVSTAKQGGGCTIANNDLFPHWLFPLWNEGIGMIQIAHLKLYSQNQTRLKQV